MKLPFYYFLLTILIVSCNKQKEQVNLFPVASENVMQFIDREGNVKINPQFREVSTFREGLALVKTIESLDGIDYVPNSGKNEKYGFINEKGEFVVPAKYMRATVFSDGLAWVVEEGGYPKAIDKNGKTNIELKEAESVSIFSEGLANFTSYNKNGELEIGVIDKKGKKLFSSSKYKSVGLFSEGLSCVQNDNKKYGYIDRAGNLKINFQFDEAEKFVNGYAIVKIASKYGVIEASGKFVINPEYQSIRADKDKFLVLKNGRWGWCDTSGKIIINNQFAEALPFFDNSLAPVKLLGQNLWGYIDIKGKITINPQFNSALPFDGNLALVEINRQIGFIDINGLFKINPQYSNVSKDYIEYILGNHSVYPIVDTDYFDPVKVAEKINFQNIEGLSAPYTISKLFEKYKSTLDTEKTYQSNLDYLFNIFDNKKIGENIYLSLKVSSYNLFNEIQTQESWYPEYKINPNAKIDVFTYEIKLDGSKKEKKTVDSIVNAITKSITSKGYQKTYSYDSYLVFERKKSNYSISVSYDYANNSIIVEIVNNSEYDL